MENKIPKNNEGFAGTLSNIDLTDLIQMCCISLSSLSIVVIKDDLKGTIVIKKGDVIHAVYSDLVGEKAFYEILGWKSGRFETFDSQNYSEVTIKQNYQYLLMEAAHREDEKLADKLEKNPDNKNYLPDNSHIAEKLKIMIVDDSPVMRRILCDIFTSDDNIDVAGIAENGEEALVLLDKIKPDIITLDVNMPVMSGSTALKHIMIKNPCPVVIISNPGNDTHADSHTGIFDFLRIGAVDYIKKPVRQENMLAQEQQIIKKVFQVSKAKINNFKRVKNPKIIPYNEKISSSCSLSSADCKNLVIINSGIGGFSEIIRLVSGYPKNSGTCFFIFQDMPSELTEAFAFYLDKRSRLDVLAVDYIPPIINGHCYINADNLNLNKEDKPIGYKFDDFLMSVSESFDGNIIIVFLSGAQAGSINNIKKIKKKNMKIIAQHPSYCLIPDFIEEAVRKEIIDQKVNPLNLSEEIDKSISAIDVKIDVKQGNI